MAQQLRHDDRHIGRHPLECSQSHQQIVDRKSLRQLQKLSIIVQKRGSVGQTRHVHRLNFRVFTELNSIQSKRDYWR